MNKKIWGLLLLVCLMLISLNAQSADKMTELLETDAITWGQAIYFSVAWQDQDITDEAQAIAKYSSENKLPKSFEADNLINLKNFAGLCMTTWKIKGGLLYSMTKANRYAFRELKAKGLITEAEDPLNLVSGRKALNLFAECQEIITPITGISK